MAQFWELELSFLYWLQELHGPILDRLMTGASFLGNKGWFFVFLGILLFLFPRTRRVGLAVLFSLALGFLVGNLFLKNAVMRPRPCWIDGTVALLTENPGDYSFPSGHSLASFETAVSIWFFDRKWGLAFLVLAAVIAFSRMYLFVHFPTDVAGGIVLGIFHGWIVHRVLEKGQKT